MFKSSCAIAAVTLLTPISWGQQVTITDQIPGTFMDISGTGLALGLADEGVVEVTPGFSLTQTLFEGDGSGRMWVSNNGAVGFLGEDGSVGAFFLNTELPNFSLFGGSHGTPQALAVYWDDLDADTGEVYVETVGDPGSRIFIVQWQDRPHYSGDPDLDGNEATFQLQIFENATPGHAQFIYTDLDFQNPEFDNGASATVGYQAGGIANDVQWSFNQPGAVQAGLVLTLGEPCPGCPELGDLNCDTIVDAIDVALLLGAWGLCPDPCTPGSPAATCDADLDGTCEVDAIDLALVLGAWGPCP